MERTDRYILPMAFGIVRRFVAFIEKLAKTSTVLQQIMNWIKLLDERASINKRPSKTIERIGYRPLLLPMTRLSRTPLTMVQQQPEHT